MRCYAFRISEGQARNESALDRPYKRVAQLITRVNDDCALNAVFVASVPVKVMV